MDEHGVGFLELPGLGGLSLPPLRSDETLYSWVARYHVLSSNACSRTTSRQLFGNPHAALRTDFPVQLDALVERTAGAFGGAAHIAHEHSAFGAFAPFLGVDLFGKVSQAMRAGDSFAIGRMMGLTTSRIGTPAPLKSCAACADEDVRSHYVAHWRVEQQLPGARVCPKHRVLLRVATESAHSRARRQQLILPHMLNADEWGELPRVCTSVMDALQRIEFWGRALRAKSEQEVRLFETEDLRDTYVRQAAREGWSGGDGRLMFRPMCHQLRSRFAGLEAVPGFEFIAAAHGVTGGFVGSLLRQYPGRQHPVKHLLLLAFLFESPEAFLAAYDETATLAAAERRTLLTEERAGLTQQLKTLVQEQGLSVCRAADELGMTVTLATKCLQRAGVAYGTRPRVVGTDREKQVELMLRRGDDPPLIASSLRVRRSFIKDYLAARPELREIWQNRHFERKRDAYRLRFLTTLAENPGVPIKKIRRLPSNGFQWLYNNDRAWLVENLPGLWHR
ncbi:TnsD family Tn7-like transposition protein [Uliginosibacterium gangwonense]|uniref:TnsD family Tn7-like transposition protein n=1 Tax=Uliginosibacterium gangwonense TaxID=392736 RepID=UPI00036DBDEE|nr:TnsD family Tn7-like transposition protein [Uliginosibacterium gangwonense]